ncbi:MAG TPA: NUDIX hydrolase [Thermoanaerobaculia bacterium]|nr:NUDIX hydrolase [Thermoanaerobaculia bacterium]
MAEVTPLPAASVIVVRDAPFEVLMLRRHEKSSFVPNAWVFPGGIAERTDAELGDGSALDAMRVAGVRETFEETGIWLGAPLADADRKRRELLEGTLAFRDVVNEAPLELAKLVWTSRWITPVGISKRFDTYFFLAAVSRAAIATAEQNEVVDVTWIDPRQALARHAAREMQMVFPTLRNLEALLGFTDTATLLESRRDAVIEPIEPVLINGKPALR